jgi:hypothetical protein
VIPVSEEKVKGKGEEIKITHPGKKSNQKYRKNASSKKKHLKKG